MSVAFFFGTLGMIDRVPIPHVGVKQGHISLDDSSSAIGSPCLNIRIENKSWRSGGGLSGEIGLKRSGFL
ncbi:hypothetical protein, partial [Lacticaseibacillus rhamnosus]|uniref:hypothetical protein n=1 Tax=Lacticaseibacillus rhamnosus TaxID=47715 RepID=UPI001F4CDFE1